MLMAAFDSSWLSPPADLALAKDDVHVWRASLDQPAAYVRRLAQMLCPDELERAGRFYHEQHRRRFTVRRGLLRAILGRYLGLKPGQLCFRYGPGGKPSLASPLDEGQEALRFNVSHSRGLALFALARGRELGIDLEYIRPMAEVGQIVARFFSERENEAFGALPPGQQLEAFFNCWTRKEAYVKARGEGLALSLGQFDVSLAPGEPAALLSTGDDPREAARWSLRALKPGPGYVAALAVEGHGWRLTCWQWPGHEAESQGGPCAGGYTLL
jgi:4'-phosphopantetheinyl transferase